MPKLKSQKSADLKELTDKLKQAKGAVFSGYSGTTVKDLDTFRKTLRKEKVFSKVYKLTLVKKAMKDAGLEGQIADYRQPVILSLSVDDETAPARLVKNLSKDLQKPSVFWKGLWTTNLLGVPGAACRLAVQRPDPWPFGAHH